MDELLGNLKRIVFLTIFLISVKAIPPQRLEQAGPCVGMDCMHGVLMHGDTQPGDSHGNEDVYTKLQQMDEENIAKQENLGPCIGGDCLHDLMHGAADKLEADGILHMEQKNIGPELKAQDGPCEGMECLHGVLMHADKETGKLHELEDEQLRQVEENKEQEGPCIDCAEGRAHKHLPLDHTRPTNDETELQGKPGAKDPHEFLHTSGIDAHNSEQQNLEIMLEGLGVESPDKFLHAEGFDHNDVQPVGQNTVKPRSGTFDPDLFLHSDPDVHEQHPKSVLKKVVSGTYDPHEALHGGDARAHDRRQDEQKLQEIIEKHEHKDYQRQREQMQDPDDVRGFSLPFISDTVVDEVEQMKVKYLQDMYEEDIEQLQHDLSIIELEEKEQSEEWEDEVEIEDMVDELLEAGIEFAEEMIEQYGAEPNLDGVDINGDRLASQVEDVSDTIANSEKYVKDQVEKNLGKDGSNRIQRVIRIDNDHAHPDPYSSNYRTGRDTAL